MTVLIDYIFQFLLHGSGDSLDDRAGDEDCDDRTGSKCATQGNTTGSQQDVQCHPHIFHQYCLLASENVKASYDPLPKSADAYSPVPAAKTAIPTHMIRKSIHQTPLYL